MSTDDGGGYIQGLEKTRPMQQNQETDRRLEKNRDIVYRNSTQLPAPDIKAVGGNLSGIEDSGNVTTSHHICQPGPQEVDILVATLFYKSANTQHPYLPQRSLPGSVSDMLSEPSPTADFSQTLTDLQHLLQRIPLSHRCLDSVDHPRVVEVKFSPPLKPESLTLNDLRRHESIRHFECQRNIEVVLQKESVFRKHKKLAVFDMDSTLIQQEVIDEIAKCLGVEEKVSEITSRAMNGELDFTESLKARVALLAGTSGDVFEKLKSVISITPGARELCKALKCLGFKMAVLSGGFTPLAEWLKDQLGLDYCFANNLVQDASTSTLTGTLTGPIVDAERKATLLADIAAKENIPLHQVLAVGDGANDLRMMAKAGMGVAFNAKPLVQLEAPSKLNSESLQDILYILGYTKDEQDELTA